MIVTLSSVGGAPGVTSWATLLAAAWPPESDTDRVVVEADLDGAVMGARFGIGVDPGTSALVAAARRIDGSTLDLTDIGRRVDPRVWLVPGPESAEVARQLWATPDAPDGVAAAAARDRRVWFFDVGRGAPNGPMAPVFARSVISILVCRPEHESLVQVPARVAAMKQAKCITGVLVTGKPSFETGELQAFFGSHMTWIAGVHDDIVATSSQVFGERRIKRSQLWRTAVAISTDVADTVQYRTMTLPSDVRSAVNEVFHGE